MSARAQDSGSREKLPIRQPDAAADAILHHDLLHIRPPAELAAKSNDLLPQRRNDPRQAVAAQVGMAEVQNIFRRGAIHEGMQHKRHALVLDPRVKFAVRPRSGTAFPVKKIAFFIQGAGSEKRFQIRLAAYHIKAPFQHHRFCPGKRQHIRSKQARRTGTDHDGIFQFMGVPELRQNPTGTRLRMTLAILRACGLFQFRLHPVKDLHIRLFPGIEAAPEDPV